MLPLLPVLTVFHSKHTGEGWGLKSLGGGEGGAATGQTGELAHEASISLMQPEKLSQSKLAHFKLIETLLELIGFWPQIALDWRSTKRSCRSQSQSPGGGQVFTGGAQAPCLLAHCWKPIAHPREATRTVLPTISRHKAQHEVTACFSHAELMLILVQQSCEVGMAVIPNCQMRLRLIRTLTRSTEPVDGRFLLEHGSGIKLSLIPWHPALAFKIEAVIPMGTWRPFGVSVN